VADVQPTVVVKVVDPQFAMVALEV